MNRLVVAALVLLGAAMGARADVADPGRALFEGRHPALRETTLPGDARSRVPIEQAACVSCHRPSGLGSFEGGVDGGVSVPPISSGLLAAPYDPATTRRFSAGTQLRIRPAYDAEALQRLLNEGVTPDGRTLAGLMPRYKLDRAQASSLLTHLNRLGVDPAPGVDDDVVHFATITTDDVPEAREQELLRVMQAFVDQKNAGTRQELKRRSSAIRNEHVMYSRYRKWTLHHWRLNGPPSTWRAQLDAAYRARPVFAVLSGTSDQDWGPVHAFCESERVPCLLPIVTYPGADGGFYSVYLSGGAPAQARWLADHVQQQRRDLLAARWRVLVGDGPAAQALGERIASELRVSGVDASAGPARAGDAVIVSALGLPATQAALASTPLPGNAQVFLLAGAGQPGPAQQGPATDLRFDWVTHQAGQAAALARARGWWRGREFRPRDEAFAAQVLLALTVASETLVHVDERFSREYCLEKLEHNMENVPPMTSYPRLSLGPTQRFAARTIWLEPGR